MGAQVPPASGVPPSIDRYPRTFKMRIFLDKKYQELNNLVIDSLKFIFPKNKVSVLNHTNHLILNQFIIPELQIFRNLQTQF